MTALETAIVVQSAGISNPLLSAQFLVDCTPVILNLSLNVFGGSDGGCYGGLPQQVFEVIEA